MVPIYSEFSQKAANRRAWDPREGSAGPLRSDRAAELMAPVMAQRQHFREVNLISDVLRCHRCCPFSTAQKSQPTPENFM